VTASRPADEHTQTAADKPTFDELLADPNEQFDVRSELRASVLSYLSAPPATAGTKPWHPNVGPNAVWLGPSSTVDGSPAVPLNEPPSSDEHTQTAAERLTELEGLREAARNSPPWRDWPHGVWTLGGLAQVARTAYPADAALIVAAVNALPDLIAAVRCVLEVADELGGWGDTAPSAEQVWAADRIRAAVASALDRGPE
jgi:hypothetical protein